MSLLNELIYSVRAKIITLLMIVKNRNSKISLYSYVSNNNDLSNKVKIADGCRVFGSEIGIYSYLADHACITNTSVGSYTSIGPGSRVNLGDHPSNLVSTSPATFSTITKKKYSHFKKVIIGNDVWIGANVLVKGGIKISDGAIIGAGSYVNKDIPPYAIAVGSPAKVIKYRFSEDEIKAFLTIKWWCWEASKVQLLREKGEFDDVKTFIQEHYNPCD